MKTKCQRCLAPAISKGLCSKHSKTPLATKAVRFKGAFNHKVYSTKRWKVLRLLALDTMPLCLCCERYGILTPAQEVDHITPIKLDHGGAYRLSNLQCLCKPCHSRKTTYETKGVIYNYRNASIVDLNSGSVTSL